MRGIVTGVFSIIGLFLGLSVAGAETKDCPTELPSGVEKKEAKCPKADEPADVKSVTEQDGKYKDYYLYCGTRLQKNLLPSGIYEPICWKIDGQSVTIWYKNLAPSPSAPSTPPSPEK